MVHANGQCEHANGHVTPVVALDGCPNGPNDGPSDGHSVHGVGSVQLHS